jgi:hypothetical protein
MPSRAEAFLEQAVIKVIQSTPPVVLKETDCPALRNSAVAHCAAVWQMVHQTVLAKSKSDYCAERDAGPGRHSSAMTTSAPSSPAPATACSSVPSQKRLAASFFTPPRSPCHSSAEGQNPDPPRRMTPPLLPLLPQASEEKKVRSITATFTYPKQRTYNF